MLILGCDVGSETHYLRAIDTRDRELGRSAFRSAMIQKDFSVQRNRQIWYEAKLRGCGYGWAGEILRYVKTSVGIRDGAGAGRTAVEGFVKKSRN